MKTAKARQGLPLARRLLAGWRPFVAALAVGAALATPAAQAAEDPPPERVQVADPYLELHTGAGRGYPVFFVVQRSDWVDILSRHTDWFKVRTEGGKEGWVSRAQLERTLTAAGVGKTFRDILVDDYLRRKLEMGLAWGSFNSEPMIKLYTAYRVSDTLSLEATFGQVQGTFSGTDIWHLGINAEPWSHQRWSPYFGIGVGKFKNVPNNSLVSDITVNVTMSHATAGLRYYISDRFVARLDYTIYTAFIDEARTGEYRATTLGISFFF
jgi:SH3 domain-containing protein